MTNIQTQQRNWGETRVVHYFALYLSVSALFYCGHVTGGQVEATTCNNKVYVEEGSTALLPCLLDLENLGRRMVIWKKTDNVHPLAIGDFVHPLAIGDFVHPLTIGDFVHPLAIGDFVHPLAIGDFVHPLAIGDFVYVSDSRVSVIHPDVTNRFTLAILDVRMSDTGVYECQLGVRNSSRQCFGLQVV